MAGINIGAALAQGIAAGGEFYAKGLMEEAKEMRRASLEMALKQRESELAEQREIRKEQRAGDPNVTGKYGEKLSEQEVAKRIQNIETAKSEANAAEAALQSSGNKSRQELNQLNQQYNDEASSFGDVQDVSKKIADAEAKSNAEQDPLFEKALDSAMKEKEATGLLRSIRDEKHEAEVEKAKMKAQHDTEIQNLKVQSHLEMLEKTISANKEISEAKNEVAIAKNAAEIAKAEANLKSKTDTVTSKQFQDAIKNGADPAALEAVNAIRTENGLPALSYNKEKTDAEIEAEAIKEYEAKYSITERAKFAITPGDKTKANFISNFKKSQKKVSPEGNGMVPKVVNESSSSQSKPEKPFNADDYMNKKKKK